MADDNEIKLNIKSEADISGAQKAEKSIDEVGDAAKEQGQQAERAADATEDHERALNRASDAARDGVASLEDLTEWTKKNEEAEREAIDAQNASAEASELVKIRRASQGQALSELGRGLGEVSRQLRAAGADVGQFDEGLGRTLETIGEIGETAGSVVSGAAAGFAVAGPIGAAVGGLTGVVKGLFDAWVEGEKQVKEAEERRVQAVKNLTQTYKDLGEERAKATLDRFQSRLNDELETLRKQGDEIERIIALDRRRRELDQKVENLERVGKFAQLDRDVAAGRKEPEEASAEKAIDQTRDEVSSVFDPVRAKQEEIEALKRKQDAANEQSDAIGEAIDELKKVQGAAQEDINEGTERAKEAINELGERNNGLLRDLAVEALESSGEAEGLVDFTIAKIKELEAKQQAALAVARNSVAEAGSLSRSLAQEIEGAERQKERILANKTAENLDRFKQGADRITNENFRAFDDLIEAARSNGAPIKEATQKMISVLDDLRTDTVNNSLQSLEISSAMRKVMDDLGNDSQNTRDTINRLTAKLAETRQALIDTNARIGQIRGK